MAAQRSLVPEGGGQHPGSCARALAASLPLSFLPWGDKTRRGAPLASPWYPATQGVFASCCHGKVAASQWDRWAPSIPIAVWWGPYGWGRQGCFGPGTLGKFLPSSHSLPEREDGISGTADVESCQILCLSSFCLSQQFGN